MSVLKDLKSDVATLYNDTSEGSTAVLTSSMAAKITGRWTNWVCPVFMCEVFEEKMCSSLETWIASKFGEQTVKQRLFEAVASTTRPVVLIFLQDVVEHLSFHLRMSQYVHAVCFRSCRGPSCSLASGLMSSRTRTLHAHG